MPWGDWQFYAVSIAALLGLWVLGRTLVRPFLARRRKVISKRASLTIEGKKRS